MNHVETKSTSDVLNIYQNFPFCAARHSCPCCPGICPTITVDCPRGVTTLEVEPAALLGSQGPSVHPLIASLSVHMSGLEEAIQGRRPVHKQRRPSHMFVELHASVL